ncbi:hypothetical protein RRG08_034996 [Elysia crispata]|uniref:Uncharacterized protein n=1 Tax=Elysia crispata TaxID=231223 RepID=A0AAE1CR91_9GAST|nr:hypothetical protein RRG08_034996 [Elysia crispata]
MERYDLCRFTLWPISLISDVAKTSENNFVHASFCARIEPLPLTGLQDRTKMASGLEDFDFLELRVYDIHGFARGRVVPKSAIKDVIKNGTRVSGCKGHPYHLITSGQE